MKLTRSVVALLVLATVGAAAQAQAGKTREQVLGELAEARRMGDIVAPGCGGGTLRENFPHRYSSPFGAATERSATEVQRTEDLVTRGKGNAEPNLRR